MGMAEVVPGVSGGTIAFITNIYERLLNAIKSVGPSAVTAFKRDGLAGLWAHIDGTFLVTLLGGMFVGIVVGVFGISHLLVAYPEVLWAFFFGLIVASALYIGKQVTRWSAGSIVLLLVGAGIAYYISIAAPAQGTEALWYVFVCGMVAISALILPGISGSFILLLMGMYTYVVPMVKEFLKTFSTEALSVVVVFGLGCLTGLLTFSRILSWTFNNYRNATLALLTGFMIGSLNKIWPWRHATEWLRDPKTGEFVLDDEGLRRTILEENVLPGAYEGNPYLIAAILAAIGGFLLVFLLEKLDDREETAPAVIQDDILDSNV